MLIRPEAIAARRFTSFSRPRPTLTPPIAAGCIAVLCVLAGGVYLASTSTYRERVTVSGYLIPPSGVARVLAPRSGVIDAMYVEPGAFVHQGDALLRIVSTAHLDQHKSHGCAVAAVQRRHAAELEVQEHIVDRESDAARAAVETEIAGMTTEMAVVDDQITAQQRWLQVSNERLARHHEAAARGAVARTDLLHLHGESIAGEVQLKTLERVRVTLARQLGAAAQRKRELSVASESRRSSIALARIDLDGRALERERAYAEVVVAPMDGQIASLPARLAADVVAGRELAVLMPRDTPLAAELLVPLRAMGLIEVGQTVSLRYDALPFQEYGVFPATVEAVSAFVMDRRDAYVEQPPSEPTFRVIARVESLAVDRDGTPLVLRPGMTLRADVSLQNVTVMRWLLEPLMRLSHGPFRR